MIIDLLYVSNVDLITKPPSSIFRLVSALRFFNFFKHFPEIAPQPTSKILSLIFSYQIDEGHVCRQEYQFQVYAFVVAYLTPC